MSESPPLVMDDRFVHEYPRYEFEGLPEDLRPLSVSPSPEAKVDLLESDAALNWESYSRGFDFSGPLGLLVLAAAWGLTETRQVRTWAP